MSFDNILDTVLELPEEQQESLVYLIKNRLNEKNRAKIAADARISMEEFENNYYQPEIASELITRLHESLEEDK